jgi:hypothetical protein
VLFRSAPGIIFGWNIPATTGVVTESSTIPAVYTLEQNYPNPFNPSTTIRFALPHSAVVRLTVYNAIGQEVSTLFEGAREAGTHSIQFDASRLSSGVYFYTIDAGAFRATKKMVLMR